MRKPSLFIVAALAGLVAYWATLPIKPSPSFAAVHSGSLHVIDPVIPADLPIANLTDAF